MHSNILSARTAHVNGGVCTCMCVYIHVRGYWRVEKKIASRDCFFFFPSLRSRSPFSIIINRPPQKPGTVPYRGPKYLHTADTLRNGRLLYCFSSGLSTHRYSIRCTTRLSRLRRLLCTHSSHAYRPWPRDGCVARDILLSVCYIIVTALHCTVLLFRVMYILCKSSYY